MLDYMRKNARSTAIKIIYGVIIVVFCFWGVGIMGDDRINVAAMVDGEPITAQEYTLAFERMQRAYRDIYREGFNAQVAAQLNLEQRALDELVITRLLKREATRLGLQVRDDEVRESILNIPTFHDGGRFDRARYLAALRASRVTPTEFEEAQREALLISKLESLITDGVYVGDREIEDLFTLESEKIDVAFVKVPYARFRDDVTVDDAAVAAYYEEHREQFRVPEQLTLTYVAYTPEAFLDRVPVTDETVHAYYDTHLPDYETPERLQLSHILIAMAPDADEATKAAARTKAEGILAEAQDGADFGALAREHSDDLLSADAGGDLGFVERGAIEEALEAAVFALEAGTLAATVVETPSGLHIVRVGEKSPIATKPVADVRDDIVRLLQERGADDTARDAMLADAERARGGETLAALAEARGLTTITTAPTAVGAPIPGVEGGALANAAQDLKAGEVGEVEGAEAPYYLFSVDERTESTIEALESVHDRIVEVITHDTAKTKAEAEAERLLEVARSDGLDAMMAAAATGDYTVDTTGPVGRNDSLTKLDRVPLTNALFQLSTVAPAATQAYLLPEDAVALVLKERIPPRQDEFTDEKRESLRSAAVSRRRNETLEAYRDLLRQRADISVNPSIITGAV
jgi:peptidyl-prolyl cis-trans isomerase D